MGWMTNYPEIEDAVYYLIELIEKHRLDVTKRYSKEADDETYGN